MVLLVATIYHVGSVRRADATWFRLAPPSLSDLSDQPDRPCPTCRIVLMIGVQPVWFLYLTGFGRSRSPAWRSPGVCLVIRLPARTFRFLYSLYFAAGLARPHPIAFSFPPFARAAPASIPSFDLPVPRPVVGRLSSFHVRIFLFLISAFLRHIHTYSSFFFHAPPIPSYSILLPCFLCPCLTYSTIYLHTFLLPTTHHILPDAI